MKNLCFFLLFFIVTGLQAQISLSRVVYNCENKLGESNLHNGTNTLHFDKERSLYIHDNYPNQHDIAEEGFTVSTTIGDREGLPVFIDKQRKVMYSKVVRLLGGYSLSILQEVMPSIKWEITGQNKTIDRFNCISATGFFEGRTYDVWFTPDIPVSFGPYKLGGLPGLILEAKSKDGKVSYSFEGYEAVTAEPTELKPPTNGVLYTWEAFKEARINYKYQKESKSNGEYTISISDPYPDWHIEKGKYAILKEYMDEVKRKKRSRD